MVGNQVIFCTYIQTERVRKFITVSNEFSCGKVQMPRRFCSKPSFSYILYFSTEPRAKKFFAQKNLFAQGCVGKHSLMHKTLI